MLIRAAALQALLEEWGETGFVVRAGERNVSLFLDECTSEAQAKSIWKRLDEAGMLVGMASRHLWVIFP